MNWTETDIIGKGRVPDGKGGYKLPGLSEQDFDNGGVESGHANWSGESCGEIPHCIMAVDANTPDGTASRSSDRPVVNLSPDWSRDGIEVILPLPPKELRPRARVHWADKARATKSYRALAAMEARVVCAGNPPKWERATVLIQWLTTRAATVDPDAVVASVKAALDGLQDAGVVVNDRALFPERPVILTKQPWSCVKLTVRQEAAKEATP